MTTAELIELLRAYPPETKVWALAMDANGYADVCENLLVGTPDVLPVASADLQPGDVGIMGRWER